MQRFKAWLFVWLMGEHFNEQERHFERLEKRIDDLTYALATAPRDSASAATSQPTPKKKVIQSRNWADFQRLAGDADGDVQ